jgi:hypothetical protein
MGMGVGFGAGMGMMMQMGMFLNPYAPGNNQQMPPQQPMGTQQG